MRMEQNVRKAVVAGLGIVIGLSQAVVFSQSTISSATPPAASPVNDAPNPYRTVENWAQLPEGRMWGSLSAVDVDRDGKSVWVAERCGGNSACLDSPKVDPILHFDASGKLVRSFGAGLLVSPHGIYVDKDGNVWVTDYQDNAPRPARGAAPARRRRAACAHLSHHGAPALSDRPPVPPKAIRCSNSARTASCC